MPRTPEQYERLRARRRQEILDAALRVYGARGFHGTEIAEIAREVGIATGLVHHYFKAKEHLFRTLFAETLAQAKTSLDQVFGREAPASEILVDLVGAYLKGAAIAPQYIRFFARAEQDYREIVEPEKVGDFERLLNGLDQALRALIRRGISEGAFIQGDPDLLAAMVRGVIERVTLFVVERAITDERPLARETAARCLALLSLGALPGKETRS